MRSAIRLIPGLAVITALALVTTAVAENEARKVPILQKWSGIHKDEKLQKESPSTGYVINATTFAKLWKTWRPDEKVPEVNFKEEIVLVATAPGPNEVTITPQLSEKGNLVLRPSDTLVEGPGFGYQIVVIKRAGIKTIQGKPIVNDD